MANTYQDVSFCKFTVCEQRFQFKMIFQINIYKINNKKIFIQVYNWVIWISNHVLIFFKMNGNAQFISVFFTVRQLVFMHCARLIQGNNPLKNKQW